MLNIRIFMFNKLSTELIFSSWFCDCVFGLLVMLLRFLNLCQICTILVLFVYFLFLIFIFKCYREAFQVLRILKIVEFWKIWLRSKLQTGGFMLQFVLHLLWFLGHGVYWREWKYVCCISSSVLTSLLSNFMCIARNELVKLIFDRQRVILCSWNNYHPVQLLLSQEYRWMEKL